MDKKTSREAFEADAGPMGFDMRRQAIAVPEPWAEYVDLDTGHRWAGWQAATLAERDRCAALVVDSVKHTRLECLEAIRKGEAP